VDTNQGLFVVIFRKFEFKGKSVLTCQQFLLKKKKLKKWLKKSWIKTCSKICFQTLRQFLFLVSYKSPKISMNNLSNMGHPFLSLHSSWISPLFLPKKSLFFSILLSLNSDQSIFLPLSLSLTSTFKLGQLLHLQYLVIIHFKMGDLFNLADKVTS